MYVSFGIGCSLLYLFASDRFILIVFNVKYPKIELIDSSWISQTNERGIVNQAAALVVAMVIPFIKSIHSLKYLGNCAAISVHFWIQSFQKFI